LNDFKTSDALRQSLSQLPTSLIEAIHKDWLLWARGDQLPPEVAADVASWRVWLILGGRGAGKTRAGAEWVRDKALGLSSPYTTPVRIALVGETHADVRRVMIDGTSGILAVHGDDERPKLEATRAQLVWPNGSIAQFFSAETPDSLRGPQFDYAWCDELAKFRDPDHVWDMLQFALRLGHHPQAIITTTPRPLPILKKLMSNASTVVTHAATAANSAALAPSFISEMTARYAGTALGRQELMGEIIEEFAGSLWRRDWIDGTRVEFRPEMSRIVVAIDPPVTSTARSDDCGIVVAGVGADGRGYILADRSLQGRKPNEWARAAVAAYKDFSADRIVAEVNQGGDMVEAVLKQVDDTVPVTKVHATRGKWVRAEPVAALYAEGRVAHVGSFPVLEDQLCAFGADGRADGQSPDRLDALVWALTDLMLSRGQPGIRSL
jgi:phage terminase large subunit-like protein